MSSNDRSDTLREWRWHAYRDHLEDLGYDLDGGSVHPDADATSFRVGEGGPSGVAVVTRASRGAGQAGARSGTR